MTAADETLRVPYPRWRRWVRSMRRRTVLVRSAESGGDPNDRVYLAYGVVLLALVYGPILWSAVAQAARASLASTGTTAGLTSGLTAGLTSGLTAGLTAGLTVGLTVASGLVSVAAVVSARAGWPLWVSPAEATFVLGGQFAPRAVLRRRAVVLALGAAILGAFGATAVASGAGAVPREAVVWGLMGGLGAQVPLAVGAAAQAPRWRRAAWAGSAALLALGGLGLVATLVPDAPESPVLPRTSGLPVLLTGAALVGAACVLVVLRVLPGEVDVDEAASGHGRTVAAGRGLVGGESGGVADVLGARRYAGRGATFARALLRRAPVAARDLLGLRRRPGAAVGSVALGAVAAAFVLAGAAGGTGGALLAVAGAAGLYAASVTWADGLRSLATQPEPGRLLPGSPGRLLAAHLAVPVAGAAIAGALAAAVMTGLGSLGVVGPVDPGAGAVLAGVLVVTVATRAWVAGATAAPPGLFSPMMTPNGDMSMLVVGAWFLRGWLLVVGVAWLLQRTVVGGGAAAAGAPVTLALAVAGAAGLAWAAARRLARA